MQSIWERLLALWHAEPARVSAAVAAVAVAVLAAIGYATDVAHVTPWVLLFLPVILGGGEATRAQVKPLRRPVELVDADGDDAAHAPKAGA